MRERALKILAWLGLIIILPGLVISFSSSATWVNTGQLGSGIGFAVSFYAGIVGTIFALVGGLVTKPKRFWIAAIVVGMAYISSFYGWGISEKPWGIFVILLPGLVLIGTGLVIRRIRISGVEG